MNRVFQYVVFGAGVAVAVLLTFCLYYFSSSVDENLYKQDQKSSTVVASSSANIETFGKDGDEKEISQKKNSATSTSTTTPKKGDMRLTPIQKTEQKIPVVDVGKPATRNIVLDTMIPSALGEINQRDVWNLTNTERERVGLHALSYSKKLNAIAEAKATDMLTKQYFEHESPTGVGIKDLAENFDYTYLSIGENLALGNFASSSAVVDGWMNSPGHRANILKKDFSEIGISAIKGNYHGEEVWFVVQEFGRPLSECPSPDDLLKQKITIFNSQLTSLETTLNNLEAEIAKPTDDIAVHNSYVHDYNTIVTLYNNILSTTKTDIQSYNKQIESYNTCVTGE